MIVHTTHTLTHRDWQCYEPLLFLWGGTVRRKETKQKERATNFDIEQVCRISSPFFKSQISKRWLSKERWKWCGCNLMFKYLSPEDLFSYGPSARVIFSAKKNKWQFAISGTLCAYFRRHSITILKRLSLAPYTEIKT